MTTSDGDTVSISLAAVEQLHSEAFRGAVGGTRLDYRNTSQSSNVSVQINIDGSLDAEEMADIRELLAQLNNTSGDPRAAPDATEFAEGGGLDSLQSFQYSYQRQASVEYSSKRLVAFA